MSAASHIFTNQRILHRFFCSHWGWPLVPTRIQYLCMSTAVSCLIEMWSGRQPILLSKGPCGIEMRTVPLPSFVSLSRDATEASRGRLDQHVCLYIMLSRKSHGENGEVITLTACCYKHRKQAGPYKPFQNYTM
jgi:hypothetical protein